MAKLISKKMSQVGSTATGAVKNVGNNIANGTEAAIDYVMDTTGIETEEGKDFGVAGIKEHMDVIASCGKKVGVIDDVEADAIKLTRKDSPDDQHHFIPVSWVARVDGQVHLNKNSKEAVASWKSDSTSCGCDI